MDHSEMYCERGKWMEHTWHHSNSGLGVCDDEMSEP